MDRLRGLFVLDESTFDLVYGPNELRAISRHVDLVGPRQCRKSIENNSALLNSIDVLFSGWTPPRFDEAFFDRTPNLKALFYAAGAVSIPDSVLQRGVKVSTAHVANSQPVAEYTLATILFSLKHGWRLARQTRQARTFADRNAVPGCYGATVGLISLGTIARILLKLLASFDLNVVVYDPFLTDTDAIELGVKSVSLEQLFQESDVVSLHTPLKPETVGMISRQHLASMKHGATFINTARGNIVRQDELIEVATERTDLQFVLDVTDPEEPPRKDSALYDLPNVVLTPHIAGSAGAECRRMGGYMVSELERFVEGKPLRWALSPAARVAPGPVGIGRLTVDVARKPASKVARSRNGNNELSPVALQ